MANDELVIISDQKSRQNKVLFFAICAILLFSVGLSAALDKIWVLVIPFIFLIVYATIVDLKLVFFLLFSTIAFSTEISFSNGFATDFPVEFFVIYLMFAYIAYVIYNVKNISSTFFRHPLSLLLVFHTLWIGVSCFHSHDLFVSVKFFLAKIWYVVTFYFLAGMMIKKLKDLKTLFWCVYLPVFLTTCIILVRHAAFNFDFKHVNYIFDPFYRNHVDYACLLALIFPYIFFSVLWYRKWSNKWLFLVFGLLFIFVAINLSYTRAAVVAIIFAAGAYYIVKWRLMKPAMVLAFASIVALVVYLSKDNKYLRLAPNYDKTTTQKSYEDLLEATYKLEDISTMERVYRWVAGFQMFKKEPIFGFGPGNFYFNYKSYTVSSFRTYVSRNPEKSGIHSYYLMTLVEQGIIGFAIFMLLIFYALAKAEKVYHALKDRESKLMLMAGLMSFVVILSLLLINDMIETDKVGPFFFLSLVIITNMDLKSQEVEEDLSKVE
jgi:O-antigen ligase